MIDNRKKTVEQLKKELSQKIKLIKSLLKTALECEYESEDRLEYSNLIATSLRAILFGDRNNNYLSLIQRTGLDKKLYFPLYDTMTIMNILPSYNLLQFSITNGNILTCMNDNLYRTGGFWGIYLSFESWLNEVVIDTKLKDVEPLSRLLIIKIISDTNGAHVDDNYEEHYFNMANNPLLPVVIQNGVEIKQDYEIKAKFIFCETIFAIAKELIDSYETFLSIHLKYIGKSDCLTRFHKYNCSNKKYVLYKYGTIKCEFANHGKTYNSNSYYECEVYSKNINNYKFVYYNRIFNIMIIDVDNMKDCIFIYKSIYGE